MAATRLLYIWPLCMFPCSDLCIFNNLSVFNKLIIGYLYFTIRLAFKCPY